MRSNYSTDTTSVLNGKQDAVQGLLSQEAKRMCSLMQRMVSPHQWGLGPLRK